MFIDKAKITVKGGNGGNGASSFRREKFVPRGGPDGGDGGDGGSVFLRANLRLRTLLDFTRRKKFEAQRGEDGRGRNQYGRKGNDLILDVPCGTSVYQGGRLIGDLLEDGSEMLISAGGEGGRGNVHFKNSIRQAPRIAEIGEPAEEKEIDLQLKLIADVGLVGFPNAGKSTLLARFTRANPKIANYPFTTLFPNLGVSYFDEREIVFADIPGLIEGAHEGKGLGHAFLRHVERTRLLLHVVDPLGYEGKTPKQAIKTINAELKSYSAPLSKKPQVLVINKMDLAEGAEILKAIKKAFPKKVVLGVSGVSGIGLPELLKKTASLLKKIPIPAADRPELPTHLQLTPDFWAEKTDSGFAVKGKKVERLVAMTNFDLPEAVQRTQFILKKIGVERELKIKGAKEGDMVQIGNIEFEFQPDTAIDSNEAREARRISAGWEPKKVARRDRENTRRWRR